MASVRPALVFVVCALVLAGCGGTSAATGSSGADIVPATAPAFVTVDTDFNSSQWQTLDRLASRFPDKERWLETLQRELREDENVDWDRDVKPALGSELDLVWLDLQNEGENAVGLIQPQDEGAFKSLVAKSSGELVAEKFGAWYVFSDTQAKIDRFKQASEATDEKLADDATFERAMDSFPDDSVLRAFVDGVAVHDLAASEGDAEAQKMIDRLGRLDWVVASIRATSDGIRSDTIVHGKAGPALNGSVPNPFAPSLTKDVPRDAIVYLTFHGSKGMLNGVTDNPLFKQADFGPLATIVRRVGTLLEGENAFYIRPSAGSIPEFTFVLEPRGGVNGVETLDRIQRTFKGDLPAQPRWVRVAGKPARKLELGQVDVVYANVGKRVAISNLPAGIAALHRSVPALAGRADYAADLREAGLEQKTQGFFWVDIRGGVKLAERLAGAPLPAEIGRNLKPLRSAVQYAASRPSEIQLTFFLRIN
jgi:Protein of unknown function (DUF3352)